MKGLLYKDFYSLSKYIGVLGALILLCAYQTSVYGSAAYLYAMVGVYVPAIIFECMCTESLNGWNRMVMTMPVTRRKVVASKYVLTLGLIIGAYGLSIFLAETMSKKSIIMMILGNPFEERMVACLMAGMSLVFNAIALPLMFKYETKNGFWNSLIVVGIPTAFYLIYHSWGQDILLQWLGEHYITVGVLYLLAASACNIVSYIISIHIYEQKEF